MLKEVKMKILIKDTTKKERELLVKKALGISLTGAEAPSEETVKLVKQYIESEKEWSEVQKEIIEGYKKWRIHIF